MKKNVEMICFTQILKSAIISVNLYLNARKVTEMLCLPPYNLMFLIFLYHWIEVSKIPLILKYTSTIISL